MEPLEATRTGRSKTREELLRPRSHLSGLPVSGRDKRLQAHSPDDLFESRVVASCRDEKCAHRDLRGIFKIFAGQVAQAQSRARRRLEKQGAGMRFLLALTPQLHPVMGLDLDPAERLFVDYIGRRKMFVPTTKAPASTLATS